MILSNTLELDIEKEFPSTLRRVGVAMSGGIESTTLLLMCMDRYGSSNVQAFSMILPGRRNWEHVKSKEICDRLGVDFHAIDVGVTSMSLSASIKLYQAATSMFELDGWFAGGSATRFSVATISKIQTKHILREEGVYLPFVGLHKPETIGLLYTVGGEHILPMTHSCNTSATPCGACSGCYERFRGFADLGLTDPANYKVSAQEMYNACVRSDERFIQQHTSSEEFTFF